MMHLDYISIREADRYSYIRIPRELVTNEYFSGLSNPSKMLYGLLFDRMCSATGNHLEDDAGHVYVIYPVKELMADLHLSNRKILACLSELEGKDLIERRKQGHGLPSRIYIRNPVSDY